MTIIALGVALIAAIIGSMLFTYSAIVDARKGENFFAGFALVAALFALYTIYMIVTTLIDLQG